MAAVTPPWRAGWCPLYCWLHAARRQFAAHVAEAHGLGPDVVAVVWAFLGAATTQDGGASCPPPSPMFAVVAPVIGMMPRPSLSVFAVGAVQDASANSRDTRCPIAGFFVADDAPREGGLQLWVNLWGRCAAPPHRILAACAQAAAMLRRTTGAAVTSLVVRNLRTPTDPRPPPNFSGSGGASGGSGASDAQAAFRQLLIVVAPELQCLSMEFLLAVFGVPPHALLRDCCLAPDAMPVLCSLAVMDAITREEAAVLAQFSPAVEARCCGLKTK